MSKKILEIPFWKVALRFTVVFLIVIAIMMAVIQFMQYRNFDAVSESLEDGTWLSYVLKKVAIAIVYGVSMTYFSRRREKNNLRR